jgi:uncharacterized protein YgiB involved in biofilm formation
MTQKTKNRQDRKVRRQGSWKPATPAQATDPKKLQGRKIRRKQIYLGLAIATGLAFLGYRFAENAKEEIANEPIDAVFYQNTAQCEADINKQQAEYPALQKKYQAGQLTEPPNPPPMQAKDCAPQMQAAQQEYDKTAPVYSSIEDCQAEGVTCEVAPASAQATGYRPIYGGTYIDPYESPSYTYIVYGGSQYRVYDSYTVYKSTRSGRVVTPHGREMIQVTTGRVSVPRHSTFSAPAKPTGNSAKGTIKGRSSSGFGSSFKSSGSGGK